VKNLRLVMNVVVYQCAWFACVLSATAILLHLYVAPAPRRELTLILLAALAGAIFESLLVASGWVRFSPVLLLGSVLPVWMVALWAVFATTLNVSLRAYRHRYAVGAVIAAVGAPLAYEAGAALGALQWVQATPALLLVACGWGVLMPVLMRTAQRFDGFAAP
jgi:Protein of unknown function (DUF2878)